MTDKARKLGEQPAYPVPNDANVNGQEGMTIHQQFAMAAMQAIIHTGTAGGNSIADCEKTLGLKHGEYKADIHYPILIARDALIQTDAMIEALAAREL